MKRNTVDKNYLGGFRLMTAATAILALSTSIIVDKKGYSKGLPPQRAELRRDGHMDTVNPYQDNRNTFVITQSYLDDVLGTLKPTAEIERHSYIGPLSLQGMHEVDSMTQVEQARLDKISAIENARQRRYATIDSIAFKRSKKVNITYSIRMFERELEDMVIPSKLIDKDFLRFIAFTESRYNPYLKSDADARGWMQITEGAWKTIDKKNDYISNVYDAKKNFHNGVELLLYIERFCEYHNPAWNTYDKGRKLAIIAASYNWGWGNVQDNGWKTDNLAQVQKSGETDRYVKALYAQEFMRKAAESDSVKNILPDIKQYNDTIRTYLQKI